MTIKGPTGQMRSHLTQALAGAQQHTQEAIDDIFDAAETWADIITRAVPSGFGHKGYRKQRKGEVYYLEAAPDTNGRSSGHALNWPGDDPADLPKGATVKECEIFLKAVDDGLVDEMAKMLEERATARGELAKRAMKKAEEHR